MHGILDWLDRIWNWRKEDAFNKQSILVWDSFKAHLTDKGKEKSSETQISRGMTYMLKPLDICLNKPFKI